MRIIVIGKSGQIATALKRLSTQTDEYDVVCLGRGDVDICDPDTIIEQIGEIGGDFVVNAAAYTDVDGAESHKEAAFTLNATGAAMLARSANALGLPIIHFSSDYVFDGSSTRPYKEHDPESPDSVYGRSKLAGDQAVLKEAHKCIVLRTAWLVSPFGHNFVKTMLRLAGNRDEIAVVDDQIGSPTYAPDLAVAVLKLIETARQRDFSWDKQRGVYHIAGAGETTWAGVARYVFKISKLNGGPSARVVNTTTEAYGARAPRPKYSLLNSDKFNRSFSHRLPHWQTGIERCVKEILAGRT